MFLNHTDILIKQDKLPYFISVQYIAKNDLNSLEYQRDFSEFLHRFHYTLGRIERQNTRKCLQNEM